MSKEQKQNSSQDISLDKSEKSSAKTTGYYVTIVLCIVLALALVLFTFCYVASEKREAQQSVQETLRFADRIQLLETAVLDAEASDNTANDITDRVKIIYTPDQTALQDVASYLQIQYDNFVNQINFLFVVLAVVVGLITLVIPIFNYAFIQKDLVERMKKGYSKQKKQYETDKQEFEELKRRINEFEVRIKERFEKLDDQFRRVSEAAVQPDDKQGEEIPSISDKPEDKAQAMYLDALVSLRKRAYQQAIRFLTDAINLDAENAKFYDMRGYAYRMMKRNEEALKDCQKAIELEPENSKYFDSRGVTLYQTKRYKDAVKDKDKAVELEADNARYYESRGVTVHEMKRYEDALNDCNKAIELEPENARYYYSRGVTLHEMKRYDDALKDCNKAIELEPENARYYNSRGVTLYEMKRYEDALKDCNKAIELEPENAEYYDSRGVTLFVMKHYDEVLENCNRAIELEPENCEYIASIARVLIKKGDLSSAQFFVDKALSIDSMNAFAIRVRGLYLFAYAKKGSFLLPLDSIQTDFDHVIIADPENVYSIICRAEFFIFTKQYDKAKADIDKALEIDPLEPEAYYIYSQYYQAIGDNEKATEYRKLADEHGYIPEPTNEEKK